MEPVDDEQLAGLVKLLPVMTGVGFITTIVLLGDDGQFNDPYVAIAVTV